MTSSSSSLTTGNSSSSESELRSLLAGEVLALYQENPFRVLNIPTDSPSAQVQKRAQKLKVWRQMGHSVADEFLVRDALQSLRDPRKRLIAELFWFHTDAADTPNTVALQKIRSGEWQQAQEIWKQESQAHRGQERGIHALHNLAVLLHARVVTIEAGKNPLIKTLRNNQTLSAEHLSLWRESLAAWREYLSCDATWQHWKRRAFDIGDKRMSSELVTELRALMPDVLLQVNRDLARRYLDANFGAAAGAHSQLMLKSGLSDATARAFCRMAIDPLKKRVFNACETFKERVRENSSISPLEISQKFSALMRGAPLLLLHVDPNKEFGAQAIRESIAQALKEVALEASSQRHFADCAQIIALALPFADSPSLKTDLRETIAQANFLGDIWKKATPCFLCRNRADDWTIYTAHDSGQQRLVFLCAAHANDGDSQPLLSQRVDVHWYSLPMAPRQPSRADTPLHSNY